MMRTSTLPLLRRWSAWQAVHHQQAYTGAAPTATTTTTTTTTHAAVVASVAAALGRLGVAAGLNADVCDGLLTVDLALQGPNGKLLAVDVTPRPPSDGDRGATAQGGRGGTPQRAWAMQQARRQALKAHGWRYVQLPAVEWLSALGDAEEEDVVVRERVLQAAEEEEGGGGGGDGHVCGSGCGH